MQKRIALGAEAAQTKRRHSRNIFAAPFLLWLTISHPGKAAVFDIVLAPWNDPTMGILLSNEITEGDDQRLQAAMASAMSRYPDHRIRAIALNSPGGKVAAAIAMAEKIREMGLVTVVPERSVCASACVLLFAAGSIKIVSPSARVGVHGAAIDGEQTTHALAVTTRLAKLYADFGVPASVIGRMVVTDSDKMTWLSQSEINMFPHGVVENASKQDFPIILSGYDSMLGKPIPPNTRWMLPEWLTRSPISPEFQRTGRELPQVSPPSPQQNPPPIHSKSLLDRASKYSSGYLFGISKSNASCEKSGFWGDGCRSGSSMRLKPYHDSTSPELTLTTHTRLWLDAYDDAFMTKSAGWCGNASEPFNDGCQAGAKAWPRTEAQQK